MALSEYPSEQDHREYVRIEAERQARTAHLYFADREEAYKAVALALSSYRWWGWRNISNTFRTWLTVVKLRMGFKMWPGA